MTPPRTRRAVAAAVAVLALLGLGACGGSSDSDTAADTNSGDTPSDEPATGDTVVIEGFKFSPTPLTVKVGTTIMVENKDSATHTLTADDESLDTGNLDGGGSGSITVDKAGEIAYHCELHDYMKGIIRVEA